MSRLGSIAPPTQCTAVSPERSARSLELQVVLPGWYPIPDALTAVQREWMAIQRESHAVRQEYIAVLGHCIRVPHELLRVLLE